MKTTIVPVLSGSSKRASIKKLTLQGNGRLLRCAAEDSRSHSRAETIATRTRGAKKIAIQLVILPSVESVTCPLLALSRHWVVPRICQLSGVKRTWDGAVQMSAFDPNGHYVRLLGCPLS